MVYDDDPPEPLGAIDDVVAGTPLLGRGPGSIRRRVVSRSP
jgi:hypothetical protein